MQSQRLKNLTILSIIVFGLVLSNSLSLSTSQLNTETHLDNIIQNGDIITFNDTVPIIDGNLESYVGEWKNAVEYSATFGDSNSVAIKVKANSTHLFMVINYISYTYVTVNTTIPIDADYNNQTHSWYAIIFDRNFDHKYGSDLTPDDIVLINYRVNGSQDAFLNGQANDSLVIDTDNSGYEDTYANVSIDTNIIDEHNITIEFTKKLNSLDNKGHDISLKQSETLPFALMVFENETALFNETIIHSAVTNWQILELESLYSTFSYIEDIAKLNVTTYISDSSFTAEENLSSIHYLLDTLGMNTTLHNSNTYYTIASSNLEHVNLFILVGSQADLSDDEVDALRSYVASGGNLLVLGDQRESQSTINLLLRHFGMELYNYTLFDEITNNSSLILEADNFADIPYLVQPMEFTNQTVNTIDYFGTAINFTDGDGESIYQFQEGDLYPVASFIGDYYIDADENGEFNSTLDVGLNKTTVVQAALELQRGGKVLACASADIFNASYIVSRNVKTLLLREVSWMLNFQFRIHYDDFSILDTSTVKGDEINVSISVYGDESAILSDVQVWVVATELKIDTDKVNLTALEDGTSFYGAVVPENVKGAYTDITIRIHLRGYGYTETEFIEVYIDLTVDTSLPLNVLTFIIFLISIGVAVFGTIVLRKTKKQESS